MHEQLQRWLIAQSVLHLLDQVEYHGFQKYSKLEKLNQLRWEMNLQVQVEKRLSFETSEQIKIKSKNELQIMWSPRKKRAL